MWTVTDEWGDAVPSEKPSLAWGYDVAIPETALAAWGARGIMDPGPSLGLLFNRQGWCYKTEENRKRLLKALNGGVLKAIKEKYKTLVDLGEIYSREANEVVLYEDDNVEAVGNSNGSFGYFYLSCWLKGGE
tara:strand:- start:835 stop:1230 length:396 start_codon:yes stop_codon:yes gene_type:complete